MAYSHALRASKDRGIWLVGSTSAAITGSKLPSNRQVFSRFFYLHTDQNKTIQDSATTTARELFVFWEKARIPVRQEYNIINKIKDLFGKWQMLKKMQAAKQKHKSVTMKCLLMS